MKILEILMYILIVFVIVWTLYFITIGFQTATVNELCLNYGWDKGMMNLNFVGYCSKEVNGHEIVMPLNTIMSEQ